MHQPRPTKSNAERQAAFRRRRSEAHAALEVAKGLPPLPAVAAIPGWRRWRQVLAQAENALRNVHEQMQSYYDERSDEWLESDKAEEFNERMQAVEELIDHAAECNSQIH